MTSLQLFLYRPVLVESWSLSTEKVSMIVALNTHLAVEMQMMQNSQLFLELEATCNGHYTGEYGVRTDFWGVAITM